jgi:hypothetical protein
LTYQVKAAGAEGISTGISLYEYHPKGWWYPVFTQRCGGPSSGCDNPSLREWRHSFVAVNGGVLDRCGSTRVNGVRWGGRKSVTNPDAYEDLILQFSVKTYRFQPKRPPGSGCGRRLPRDT